MGNIRFKVGDIVTRDGTDLHRVVDINDAGDLIDVECIKEPLGYLEDDGSRSEPWARLGDIETNLARRYSFSGDIIEPGT